MAAIALKSARRTSALRMAFAESLSATFHSCGSLSTTILIPSILVSKNSTTSGADAIATRTVSVFKRARRSAVSVLPEPDSPEITVHVDGSRCTGVGGVMSPLGGTRSRSANRSTHSKSDRNVRTEVRGHHLSLSRLMPLDRCAQVLGPRTLC